MQVNTEGNLFVGNELELHLNNTKVSMKVLSNCKICVQPVFVFYLTPVQQQLLILPREYLIFSVYEPKKYK